MWWGRGDAFECVTDLRHVHTTPKSYLELLALYGKLLNKKRQEANDGITRLQNGA